MKKGGGLEKAQICLTLLIVSCQGVEQLRDEILGIYGDPKALLVLLSTLQ